MQFGALRFDRRGEFVNRVIGNRQHQRFPVFRGGSINFSDGSVMVASQFGPTHGQKGCCSAIRLSEMFQPPDGDLAKDRINIHRMNV